MSHGYQYESAEVIATDTGVAFVDEDAVPDGIKISTSVACAGTIADRTCALERTIVESGPQPIGINSTDVSADERIQEPPYDFVQLEGTVYRVSYGLDERVEDDEGRHPVVANMSQAIPAAVLHSISIDTTEEDVDSTVVTATETGDAESTSAAEVPETPIRLDDGTYHRVYLTEPAPTGADSPLVFSVILGVALGIALLLGLSRKLRIRIRYTG